MTKVFDIVGYITLLFFKQSKVVSGGDKSLTNSNVLLQEKFCLEEQVHLYAEETGVPFERCVNEAISMWLECVACVNLEALRYSYSKKELKLVKTVVD